MLSPKVAEDFAHRCFRRTFLRLWSYANPRRSPHGKELCDTLVVCDPDVVIVSVKASGLRDDTPVSIERWRKKTTKKSLGQIHGAERQLSGMTHVIRSDGTPGLPLPTPRSIHRVAIAINGRRRAPIASRDYGRGFVHVLDELSLAALIDGCNTVTDFIAYLTAREALNRAGVEIEFESDDGGENDLVALYLENGRRFPAVPNGRLRVPDGLWLDFIDRPEVRAKRDADRVSYVWDRIIQHEWGVVRGGDVELGGLLTDTEIALRTMAREDRLARRALAESFVEVVRGSDGIDSTTTLSPSGAAYVFLAKSRGTDRGERRAELERRCAVARGAHNGNATVVVGIATEQQVPTEPMQSSYDLCYIRKEGWGFDDQRFFESLQRETGYFVSPRVTVRRIEEYPGVSGPNEPAKD
jgi:hypothetical protein